MGLVVVTTIGLVIWVVGWSLGLKSFDVFMITFTLVILGATGRILARYLPGNQDL
jgi:hypothetical protein